MSAYGLTTGSGIVEALIRAKQRGVDVRLIADKTRALPASATEGAEYAAEASIGTNTEVERATRIEGARSQGKDART